MDETLFRRIFDSFHYPVLLKSGADWLYNSAAQDLRLSAVELAQLEQWGDGGALWLSRQFYRVSASRLDGSLLLMLQPDAFWASAAENLASQLRARLNTSFGSTAALSENKAIRSDPQARDHLSALNRELYQIFRMVTQLERCSPMDGLDYRMGPVDLVQRFHRLAGEVKGLCAQANVKFTAETDLSTLSMLANGRQLDYLVLCLISNSLKNVPKQGGRVTLTLKRQQDQAVITVADNAGGFPPDYLIHPLWNDPHRLLPGRGLGLGLPLVQRIAAIHEGSLMVFPTDKGSRVVVSLPIQEPNDFSTQSTVPIEDSPGFSLAKIVLSDALPRCVYFPNPHGDDE